VQISKQKLLEHLDGYFDTVIGATFSGGSDPKKVIIRPVSIAGSIHLSRCDYFEKKCITKNFARREWPEIFRALVDSYRKAFIRFRDEEWHIELEGNSCKLKKKACQKPYEATFAHNRHKRHILDETAPFAVPLGLARADGTLTQSGRAKWTQINQFLEICSSRLPQADELHIVDFGCGKAYLTFALYFYIHEILGRTVKLIGVDRNAELIASSRALADRLGYSGLSFEENSIADFTPQSHVDIVVALHACDTASCLALAQAVHFGARRLFVAPCCQHELAEQLKPARNPILLTHGLFREHFASLLTDALRVRLLENAGYDVDVIEFVDPLHTPKNTLIYGEKKREPTEESDTEYESLSALYGVKPSLERLLRT